jgi:hypothetical protein
MKKTLWFCLYLCFGFPSLAWQNQPGILSGNLVDPQKKPLEGATVELIQVPDSTKKQSVQTDKSGNFILTHIAFGYYRLRFSYVGMQTLVLDSIYFREERFDFNITDIQLSPRSTEQLSEVVLYAEKALIESKDGNIIFNAGESALAAGSNASELLTQVPLVTKDPEGKILVRGKEPKILIDDKPVELNLQQLQDLLESMPGSSIEKIEVMTNPPPQYANEQGGVINIVTRKGRVGKSGRLTLSAGTRGDLNIGGNFNYRKQGFALNLNAGAGYNHTDGYGYSQRNNIYADSSNFFNTNNEYLNKNFRPNFRLNLDYDIAKSHTVNLVLHYNQNEFRNTNKTLYTSINRFGEIYKLSERSIMSTGENINPNASFSYTYKGKSAGETLKLVASGNLSWQDNDRDFYQQYFYPDKTPNGIDSTQEQLTDNRTNGYYARINYDRPLRNKKTFISTGGYYNRSNSHIITDASYLKKPEGIITRSELLSNDFVYHQGIWNLRGSVKQLFGNKFSVTAGLSWESTQVRFDLRKEGKKIRNNYETLLPFANLNKSWENNYNVTFSYRRTIRRPGINEQNPTIDFSDPYNTRFGNPDLEPSSSHNLDLVAGRTKPKYFINLGLGFNSVENIFSRVRTLIPGEKTQITWENISGRKEYEISTWNGFTVSKSLKLNWSASYVYNEYGEFDKTVNRYRDGGSFTSNINSSFTPRDTWNLSGNFTVNRFANPQGYAKWNWSMKFGGQYKFFKKKLIATLNIIDPFFEHQNRNYTFGPNFTLESFNSTHTRNFRLTLAYVFNNNSLAKKKS